MYARADTGGGLGPKCGSRASTYARCRERALVACEWILETPELPTETPSFASPRKQPRLRACPQCISLSISRKQYTRRGVRGEDIGPAITSPIPCRHGEGIISKCHSSPPVYACSLSHSTCAYLLPPSVVSSDPKSYNKPPSTAMGNGHGALIRHHVAQEVSRPGLPATNPAIQIHVANFQ